MAHAIARYGGWTGLAGVVLVLASACGQTKAPQPPPPFTTFASGKRLRARLLDGGDGAAKLVGFHDTMLDVDCTVVNTPLGYRCVPDERENAFQFGDAACTQPIITRSDAAPPPRFASREVQACGAAPVVTLYTIGAQHDGPQTVYSTDNGACAPVAFNGTSYELVSAGASLEPMASVTRAFGEIDGVVATGSDGSHELVDIRNHKTGVACADGGVTAVTNAVDRCLPFDTQLAAEGYYPTSDCSGTGQGIFTCYDTTCPAPSVAVFSKQTGCTAALSFATVAAAPTQAYENSTGVCEPATFGPCLFYTVGAPIDENTFPPLGHASLGSGRLKLDTLTPAGATDALKFGGFSDTTSGRPCSPMTVGGDLRCVPTSVDVNPGVTLFGDWTCKTPVAPNYPSTACPPPSVALLKHQPDGLVVVDAPIDAVYPITGQTSEHVYRIGNQGCADQGVQPIYELGAALDPSTFAPLTLRTE